MRSKAQFSPHFTTTYLGDEVEGRAWLPAIVLIGDGKVAEVEAFAFCSG